DSQHAALENQRSPDDCDVWRLLSISSARRLLPAGASAISFCRGCRILGSQRELGSGSLSRRSGPHALTVCEVELPPALRHRFLLHEPDIGVRSWPRSLTERPELRLVFGDVFLERAHEPFGMHRA